MEDGIDVFVRLDQWEIEPGRQLAYLEDGDKNSLCVCDDDDDDDELMMWTLKLIYHIFVVQERASRISVHCRFTGRYNSINDDVPSRYCTSSHGCHTQAHVCRLVSLLLLEPRHQSLLHLYLFADCHRIDCCCFIFIRAVERLIFLIALIARLIILIAR